MDTATFLAHVVAPGNFVCVCWKKTTDKFMGTRLFTYADLSHAAAYIHWLDVRGVDTWFACASYKVASDPATAAGGTHYTKGPRSQDNAENLQVFWYDADVSRPGDGKKPTDCFANLADAEAWVRNLPLPPNLAIRSGYGCHYYWVLDAPLAKDDWLPRAHQFKAYLIANAARGDIGITTDAARILRTPGSHNWKVPTQPMPVSMLWQGTPFALSLVDGHLLNYPATAVHNYRTGTGTNLVSIPGGTMPVALKNRQSKVAAAVQTDTGRRPHFMYEISTRCEQVAESLRSGGNGDSYNLWYLGHVSLSAKCDDGSTFIHDLSSGDHRYDAANVDAHFAQAQGELAKKNAGAPTCLKYDGYRQGVCPSCPFWGTRVKSPYTLGTSDFDPENFDLPDRYRRHNGWIEGPVEVTSDEHGNQLEDWPPLIADVFTNVWAEDTFEEGVRMLWLEGSRVRNLKNKDLVGSRYGEMLTSQGINRPYHVYVKLRSFLMAWIEKLSDPSLLRVATKPFDWHPNGMSIGNNFYRHDADAQKIPVTDNKSAEYYDPVGSLDRWQHAAHTIIKGRPDLQILVAASIASVLTPLSGFDGLAANFWSAQSGIGKSAAAKVAQSFWASQSAGFRLSDTQNVRFRAIVTTNMMPIIYDEVQVSKDTITDFVLDLFSLSGGQGKRALKRDGSERETGSWSALLSIVSNQNLFETVVAHVRHTEAAAVRLLPVEIEDVEFERDSRVSLELDHNHGVAGAVFAQYLVDIERQQLTDYVTNTIDHMFGELKLSHENRFYAAYCALVICGATLAQYAGLVDFDIPAMKKRLTEAVSYATNEMLEYKRPLPIVLNEILLHLYQQTIFTNHFVEGNSSKTSIIRIDAGFVMRDTPLVHVAVEDQKIRISKAKLVERLSYSMPRYRLQDLISKLGAKPREVSIGRYGTVRGTPPQAVIEIDLKHPELHALSIYYSEAVEEKTIGKVQLAPGRPTT